MAVLIRTLHISSTIMVPSEKKTLNIAISIINLLIYKWQPHFW